MSGVKYIIEILYIFREILLNILLRYFLESQISLKILKILHYMYYSNLCNTQKWLILKTILSSEETNTPRYPNGMPPTCEFRGSRFDSRQPYFNVFCKLENHIPTGSK